MSPCLKCSRPIRAQSGWYCQTCREQMQAERLAHAAAQLAKKRHNEVNRKRRHELAAAAATAGQGEVTLDPGDRPLACRVLMRDGQWLVPEQERPGKWR